jgi:hypothetical protein
MKTLNIVDFTYFIHGVWNDSRNTLKELGLYGFAMLVVLCYSMPHLPFDESRFFKTTTLAMQEYVTVVNAGECPLFQQYLPLMLADRGHPERLAEEGIVDTCWQELSCALRFLCCCLKL